MENDLPRSLRNHGPRVLTEGVGFAITSGFEVARAGLVNPRYALSRGLTGEGPQTLDPNSPVYGILQNSGDLHDGYWLSFATYNALELVDRLQHRFTKRYIPQIVKSGFTLLFAVGVVSLTETGILYGGTPDLSDIPAGVVGALFFQGVNLVGRKIT